MNEETSKSISEIMAYFDFDKVAECEEKFFDVKCDNDADDLINVIKDFALEGLYNTVKKFAEKATDDCYVYGAYHLMFYYHYRTKRMSLCYVPYSWGDLP